MAELNVTLGGKSELTVNLGYGTGGGGGGTTLINTGMNAEVINIADYYDTSKEDMSIKAAVTKAGYVYKKITDAQSYEVGSDTSLTGSVNAKAGDVVIAVITVRSALTLPDNMTLINTSEGFDSYPQTLSFAYERVTEEGTHSYTFKQASAGRIYLTLIALSEVKEVIYTGDVATVKTSQVSSVSITLPKSAHYLFGCSAVSWSSNVPWECSPTLSVVGTMARHTVFYGESFFMNYLVEGTKYTFTPNASTTCCVDAVELVFEE